MSAPRTNNQHHVRPCPTNGMDKSTQAEAKFATSRDQFDLAQSASRHKAAKNAVDLPPGVPQARHDVPMNTTDLMLAIDLPGLAAAIGANPRSLRNAFYLDPDQFPPAIYLPGTRGPRFLVPDVLIWLESRKAQTTQPPAATPKPQGRPRKASPAQIARARQGQGGAA